MLWKEEITGYDDSDELNYDDFILIFFFKGLALLSIHVLTLNLKKSLIPYYYGLFFILVPKITNKKT